MSQLGVLGQEIIDDEFSYLTGTDYTGAINQASGWFVSNLGRLNTYIYTAFSGENPDLSLEEQAVYKAIYLWNFYSKESRNVLRGVTDGAGGDWIDLREGDSVIRRQNRNEIAKSYKAFSAEAKETVDDLVFKYNYYKSQPKDVSAVTSYYDGAKTDTSYGVY